MLQVEGGIVARELINNVAQNTQQFGTRKNQLRRVKFHMDHLSRPSCLKLLIC